MRWPWFPHSGRAVRVPTADAMTRPAKEGAPKRREYWRTLRKKPDPPSEAPAPPLQAIIDGIFEGQRELLGTAQAPHKAGFLALARKGSEVWNAWRKGWPRVRVDFSGVDFSKDPVDFSSVQFGDGANFDGARFRSAHFDGAQFGDGASFVGAHFRTGHFAGAHFDNLACFDNARFGLWSSFADAQFGEVASFDGAEFQDPIFGGAQFGGGSHFRGVHFSSVLFTCAQFGDVVSFDGAHFGEGTSFAGARFGEAASFDGVQFGDGTHFDGALFGDGGTFAGHTVFRGEVSFRALTREQVSVLWERGSPVLLKRLAKDAERLGLWGDAFLNISFAGARFEGVATFENRRFLGKTDFGGCRFREAPRFHGCTLHQDTVFDGAEFDDISSAEAGRAYRTLKLAMGKQRAVREEQRFFRLEMQAETRRAPLATRMLFEFYSWSSDYGFSIRRPFFMWVSLTLALFVPYGLLCGAPAHRFDAIDWSRTLSLIRYVLINAAPLPGFDELQEGLREELFGTNGVTLFAVFLMDIGHKIAAVVLIFLLGLAIRNLFKIKA